MKINSLSKDDLARVNSVLLLFTQVVTQLEHQLSREKEVLTAMMKHLQPDTSTNHHYSGKM